MIAISVVMAVYREKIEYIETAVESILSQTFRDFEFIIILDDPTNEEALNVMEKYKALDDRVIILINERNLGLAMSLNRGIEIAKGKYIARMDADDRAWPERFQTQFDYLEKNTHVSILGTNKNFMDESGVIISKGGHLPTTVEDIAKMMKYTNVMVHSSVMMRIEDIKRIDCYRDFPTTQDLDLWLRALSAGLIICNLDEFLMDYRINSQGISMSKAFRQSLIGTYIRELAKERIETGEDSFSQQNLQKYLSDHKADDPEETKKYNDARIIFEDGRIELKRKHFALGTIKLIKAARMHPLMKKQVKVTLISSFIKRGTK